MNRLRHIPRALADLFYPWKYPSSTSKKSSLTYTLFLIKLKNWLNKSDRLIRFPLGPFKVTAVNNRSLQFLVKEIFVQEVYRLPVEIEVRSILDLGSNIGLSVLYFRGKFPTAMIEAWEPATDSFELLKKNVLLNRIKGVELVNKAASDKSGFLFAELVNETASVNRKFGTVGNEQVESFRLTDLLKQKKFDLIKMDIEGAEEEVLKDCDEQGLLFEVKCWMIEFHDAASRDRWKKRFEESGYSLEKRESVYCFYK